MGFHDFFMFFSCLRCQEVLTLSMQVPCVTVSNATQVREHFFWKTALRFFPKLGTHDQHDKTKKPARPFVGEKSGSFKDHDFVFLNDLVLFWPFS